MFPSHYFAPRYFTASFFPHVGLDAVIYDGIQIGAARAGAAGVVARVGVATSLAHVGAASVVADAGAAVLTASAGAATIVARTHLTETEP